MRYLISRCEKLQSGPWAGGLVMPREWVERWKRQMETAYADLTPQEQDSDRIEADRVIALQVVAALALPDAGEDDDADFIVDRNRASQEWEVRSRLVHGSKLVATCPDRADAVSIVARLNKPRAEGFTDYERGVLGSGIDALLEANGITKELAAKLNTKLTTSADTPPALSKEEFTRDELEAIARILRARRPMLAAKCRTAAERSRG